MLAPGLLRLGDVIPDRLVADEQPRLIEQEDFEGGQLLRIANLVAGPVQDVEQQRLQHLGRIVPSVKVEGLEAAEAERVLDVVKQKAVLPGPRPAVQALFQTRR